MSPSIQVAPGTLGRKPLGQGDGLGPERVRHRTLGIAWRMTELLDAWERPGHTGETHEQPTVISWWRLRAAVY